MDGISISHAIFITLLSTPFIIKDICCHNGCFWVDCDKDIKTGICLK